MRLTRPLPGWLILSVPIHDARLCVADAPTRDRAAETRPSPAESLSGRRLFAVGG
jgi:hypothetical protein